MEQKRKYPTIQFDDDKAKEVKERLKKYFRLADNNHVILYTPGFNSQNEDSEGLDFYLEDNIRDNDNFMNVYWKPTSKDDAEFYMEALIDVLSDIVYYELEIEKGNCK